MQRIVTSQVGPKCSSQHGFGLPISRGYQTAKWEWSGSLEVPLNLVMARALLRGDPAWVVAGRLMSDPAPERTVDRDLIRASAEFAGLQPEEYSEESLYVYQGMLTVGRLLDDPALVNQALTRLDGFMRRGFYHDGFWRQADTRAHRRIVGQLDGWIGGLLGSARTRPFWQSSGPGSAARPTARQSAREAADPRPCPAGRSRSRPAPEEESSRPPGPAGPRPPTPAGAAGRSGRGAAGGWRRGSALDVEVRGLDSYSGPHFQRLAIRLAVAGRPVLDDLDERGGTATGWDAGHAQPQHRGGRRPESARDAESRPGRPARGK